MATLPLPPLSKPFVRAEACTRCALYWFPLDLPDPRSAQRAWYNAFLTEFESRLEKEQKLLPGTFIQTKDLADRPREHLIRKATELVPVIGMSLVPGKPMPRQITVDDVKDKIGRGDTNFSEFIPGMCYWFLKGRDLALRAPLFGSGNVTELFLAPIAPLAAEVKIPAYARKLVPETDCDEAVQATMKMQHPFQKKSKELFGAPYIEEISYHGWSFILPTLGSAEFFSLPEQDIANLLTLSPVYLHESKADAGVIIASKEPLEPLLNGIVEKLELLGVGAA